MNPAAIQSTLNNIPIAAVYLDASGVVRGFNGAWKELAERLDWGLSEEVIGRKYEHGANTQSTQDLDVAITDLLSGERKEFRAHFLCGSDSAQSVLEVSASSCEDELPGVLLQYCQRSFLVKNKMDWMPDHFMDLLFEKLTSGVIFQSCSGSVELVNYAATQIFGLSYLELFDFENLSAVDALGRQLEVENLPAMLALKDGEARLDVVIGVEKPWSGCCWIRIDALPVYDMESRTLLGVMSSFTDITLERRAQEEISKISERLQIALDGAKIGIWDWYIKEKKMVWDERMYALYGYPGRTHLPVEEVWARSTLTEEREVIKEIMRELTQGKPEAEADFRVIWPDQTVHYLHAQARAVFDSEDNIFRVVGINWDITKEVETEGRLKEMAFQDELTGLPNRMAFNFQLNKHIAKSLVSQKRFAILVMDLNNFKDINDNFGHPTGDSLLTEVVQRVKKIVKAEDFFCRMDGDEFGVLISADQQNSDYLEMAEKIRLSLADPVYLLNGPAIIVGAAIGLSAYPDDAKDAVGLIKAADLAMYESKLKRGNDIVWYNTAMTEALKAKVEMENKLREAIRDEEFILHYQPIIDLNNRKIVGCEALIRWFDKDGKFISPVDFIPAAESSGLINELGTWVNHTAFKQFKLWQVIDTSLEYVSVNVSPHQFQYPNFFHSLIEAAEEVGIETCKIQLEITEGTFLQESLNADSHLNSLGEVGFRLAIDDFGTGYSSLSYLKRFNVDVIKIDKSFIDDIETEKTDRDIVKAIMAMTESLGFQTLVEGIEKNEQAEIVKAFGCRYAQGYYFGRPVNADEFAEKFIGLQ